MTLSLTIITRTSELKRKNGELCRISVKGILCDLSTSILMCNINENYISNLNLLLAE